jgi:hypothetical protein
MEAAFPPGVWRSAVRTITVLGALAVAYAVLPLQGDRWWLGAGLGVAAIVGILPLAVRHLRRVVSSEHPVLAAAEGLALLAGLLVLGFAAVYFAIADLEGQMAGVRTRIDALYFTITTFSTVGFGDITATGQAARLSVSLQIAFDLVTIGVFVRVFTDVARQAARRQR